MTQQLTTRQSNVCTHAAPLLIVALLLPATGTAADAPNLERQLVSDAADGKLDDWSLLEASLIASGCTDKTALAIYQKRFVRTLNRLHSQLPDQPKSSRRVLQQLHTTWLTGRFKNHCNDMRVTLQSGDYNCVTSTTLFLCLTQHWGMNCHAMSRPKHVFAATNHDEWIETTNPRAKAKTIASRKLTNVQLLAKFFYNRGISAYHQKSFAEAQRLFTISRKLDPMDPLATQNLLASYNAAALENCDEERFELALDEITKGLSLNSKHPALISNDLHIRHQWSLHLVKKNKFKRAIQIIQQARTSQQNEFRSRALLILYRDWLTHELIGNQWEQAKEVIRSGRRQLGSNGQYKQVERRAIQAAINLLKRSGRQSQATQLIQKIESHLGSSWKSPTL